MVSVVSHWKRIAEHWQLTHSKALHPTKTSQNALSGVSHSLVLPATRRSDAEHAENSSTDNRARRASESDVS